MSRASPLPRSGELSKAVMLGVTGSLRVDSDLPVLATERPLVSLLQGRTIPRGAGTLDALYAVASFADQRKSVPSTHMRCRMTASLRATATLALRMPMRLASSPTRYLNGRALEPASSTASGAAQYIARSVCPPADHERHERRWRAMLAPFAVDPQPWRDPSKVREQRGWWPSGSSIKHRAIRARESHEG
jgi:hypothetical protein